MKKIDMNFLSTKSLYSFVSGRNSMCIKVKRLKTYILKILKLFTEAIEQPKGKWYAVLIILLKNAMNIDYAAFMAFSVVKHNIVTV